MDDGGVYCLQSKAKSESSCGLDGRKGKEGKGGWRKFLDDNSVNIHFAITYILFPLALEIIFIIYLLSTQRPSILS